MTTEQKAALEVVAWLTTWKNDAALVAAKGETNGKA